MKYLVSVLLLLAWLTGCAKQDSSGESLVCQLAVIDKQGCTPVLSLESGELRLNAENRSFEMTAHYDACFQVEEVKITGEYEQRSHKNVHDIELLAKQIVIKKGGKEGQFSRTIGLVTLNINSLKGHFVDVWAMIRAHGQMGEGLERVDVSCQSASSDIP